MNKRSRPNIWRGVGHALAALFGNCVEFRRRWKAAGATVSASSPTVSRWEGEWRSEENGHHGPLRCVLRDLPDGDCEAAFHAGYAGFLRVCYCVRLKVEAKEGKRLLRGETDLGRLAGGKYSYEGDLAGDRFNCRYRCRYDHGVFTLSRR